MEVETIITLVAGIMAALGLLGAFLKIFKEFGKFLIGIAEAAEDGKITAEEFRQGAKDWAEVTKAGIGFWKSLIGLFRR